MTRGWRWIGMGAVLTVLAGAAGWAGWSAWRDEGPYGHTLVRFSDERGEANRYTNLDEGEAQLSIGSPDSHRLVVQWRDPDGHGWTAPETVWTDRRNIAIENTVRYGGGTVAIVETYTPDTSDEDDSNDVQVGIVCRDLSCEATAEGGVDSEGQVTPDGSLVYVGATERAAQWWSEDEGFHRTPWSGLPESHYPRLVLSGPALAPDGSLRLVSARRSGATCTFDLLVSDTGAADLTSAVRQTRPLHAPGSYDCQTIVDTISSDWLSVSSYDPRGSDFWFVRDGDTWTTTTEDPSGLEVIDLPRNTCCSTGVAGFVHWNDVAYGSPDGRRIQVQTHFLGDETWSEPLLLEGAPPGYRCTWLEGYEIGDGFVVLLTCHEASQRVDSPFTGDAYAVAVTADLEEWDTAWVDKAPRGPEIDEGRLRLGPLTWTPADGSKRR